MFSERPRLYFIYSKKAFYKSGQFLRLKLVYHNFVKYDRIFCHKLFLSRQSAPRNGFATLPAVASSHLQRRKDPQLTFIGWKLSALAFIM